MLLETQGTNEVKMSVTHRCENANKMDEKFSKDKRMKLKCWRRKAQYKTAGSIINLKPTPRD
jgi:hypothetical protein